MKKSRPEMTMIKTFAPPLNLASANVPIPPRHDTEGHREGRSRHTTSKSLEKRPPNLDLHGKAAVVTGGNSGIGLGIAAALVAAGAEVCIWGRDRARNAAAVAQFAASGNALMAIECDVSDESQVDHAFARVVAGFGRVDACFANAGVVPTPARLIDTSVDEWRRVLAVDLDGVFFTLRAAGRHMAQRGSGSICLVSSVVALHGAPRRYAYAAAKAGVVALARSAAIELGARHIRVNALLPAWTETPALRDLMHSSDPFMRKWRAALLARIPLQRWGRPEDLGGIAVYLASDASAYHTGDAIVIDGGYSIF